ncbi:MAG: hypothetical protein L3J16_00065 [Anaerolineales bacterium]|nr:hypothetical protein [Anaerolineales bacterium]
MVTQEKDLRYLDSGIQNLEDYLHSKVLFWPLAAPLDRLTIGGLLLAQRRLEAQNAGMHLSARLDAVRNKWRAAWEEKASREIGMRYKLWKNYVKDYRSEPEVQAENYALEVRWRTILTLLAEELPAPPADIEGLAELDDMVWGSFIPGDFIWDIAFEKGFPQDEFWFLYGTLKGK